jgi:DNA-binding GntR family transcriptional regulator
MKIRSYTDAKLNTMLENLSRQEKRVIMAKLKESKAGSKPTSASACYRLIRDDIIHGRLAANLRLKTGALADRYGTSTTPLREALQQLRGEGFVIIEPNRGARVRPMDDNFIREIYEIESLIEPYLASSFVELATSEEIANLETIHDEISNLDFEDPIKFHDLDTAFHTIFYRKHSNRQALELWRVNREILGAFSKNIVIANWRREAIVTEHSNLLSSVKRHDVEAAAAILKAHVLGSGKHLIEQKRAAEQTED